MADSVICTLTAECARIILINLDGFDEEDLIDIDSVGLMLVGANQEYTKSDAGRPDSTQPIPMIEVVT